ncbi:hypothetical protein SBF1_490003 [Candidatus Desulfosporosinus infrequens]|uniref:Uncharacterized protein n=1 Tax=Candidatus Desulfosporosinus infrequens TaxID=2043169 RepID=A0A2U3LFU9_9FIRM|nr:hypothetical protein SBF1_490003 [Candidatus Desulfosporosinus infrequens]
MLCYYDFEECGICNYKLGGTYEQLNSIYVFRSGFSILSYGPRIFRSATCFSKLDVKVK